MSAVISPAGAIDVRFRIARGDFLLDAEFVAPAKGVTALLGPSGCGKTTLLRAIAGLEHDPSGHCVVAGDHWQQGRRRMATHRRQLGYVFQEVSLLPHLGVSGNLQFGYQRVAAAERRIGLSEVIELLGVEPLLQRQVDGLSGGERQRVAIARALLTSPRLLLMDEPLAALDYHSKRDILPYLERLHRELGIPVIYVSHSADEVARLADYLVLMEQGRVVASGAVAELLARTDLPLAQSDDAEVIIEASVCDQDTEYWLTRLRFPGGEFTVPHKALQTGEAVRLRVLARDVSLAAQPPAATSILNCLAVQVVEMAPLNQSQVLVRLDAGGAPMLSRVTRKSVDILGIRPGMKVYAQIKSVALLS